jgi:hypothetical protein
MLKGAPPFPRSPREGGDFDFPKILISRPRRKQMRTSRTASATAAFTRSVLLTLGVDHALIDFLACTAIGTAAVLLAIAVAGLRIQRPRLPDLM